MADGAQPQDISLPIDELVELCAVDTELFNRSFFPKTFRQESPSFHRRIDHHLDDPNSRFVNLIAFRDAAKTTKLRAFTAKRIAYALSHTILYVGASEPHASRSILWLRSQLERNALFREAFKLRQGSKWNETELEIFHGFDDRPVWILGVGITGNIRGINFDDYRPDLIILDDILTDENTATLDQRQKVNDLVFGALRESLTPASEEPNSKLVSLNTPHHVADAAAKAAQDPSFVTETFSCWTPETLDESLERQESSWPQRYPSVELQQEKREAIAGNRYSTWAREKECKLITSENAAFKPEWLKFYDEEPTSMFCVLAVDPVPPPSDRELAKNLAGKDYEAHVVLGRRNGEYFVLDLEVNRGHEPNWSVATALSLARKHRVARIVVESIAYQRVLKYMLEQEMRRRGTYFAINEFKDTRKKYNRITSALAGPASQGRLWCSREHFDLIEQFSAYPTTDHDDILDALAMAMSDLVNPYLELETADLSILDASLPDLEPRRLCP